MFHVFLTRFNTNHAVEQQKMVISLKFQIYDVYFSGLMLYVHILQLSLCQDDQLLKHHCIRACLLEVELAVKMHFSFNTIVYSSSQINGNGRYRINDTNRAVGLPPKTIAVKFQN